MGDQLGIRHHCSTWDPAMNRTLQALGSYIPVQREKDNEHMNYQVKDKAGKGDRDAVKSRMGGQERPQQKGHISART